MDERRGEERKKEGKPVGDVRSFLPSSLPSLSRVVTLPLASASTHSSRSFPILPPTTKSPPEERNEAKATGAKRSRTDLLPVRVALPPILPLESTGGLVLSVGVALHTRVGIERKRNEGEDQVSSSSSSRRGWEAERWGRGRERDQRTHPGERLPHLVALMDI